MVPPFSRAVLAQVERLGGSWRGVPADAGPVDRVQAITFPKRLVGRDDIGLLSPGDCGVPDVDAVIALDAPLPDVPVTRELPLGVRWFGDEWQAGDIVFQWDAGLGKDFPFVDLAADGVASAELAAFREAVGDPAAGRAVLLTYGDGYPNYHLINADDPRPEDPAVWSTDHEGFFRVLEAQAPSLSGWLAGKLPDAEIYARLRGDRGQRGV